MAWSSNEPKAKQAPQRSVSDERGAEAGPPAPLTEVCQQFEEAVDYVLVKNQELYQRLA